MGKLPLPYAKHKRGGAMALNEQFLEEEIHPIDIVEHIAEHHEWEFDRTIKIVNA